MSSNLDRQGPALVLRGQRVPWDSELLGFEVGQLDQVRILDPAGARAVLVDLEAWRDAHGFRLVACRMPHDALAEAMLLEEAGFRFVEMVYPVSVPKLAAHDHPADIALLPATEQDLPELQEIARHAFQTGRFNVDPRLGPELGGRRYAGWVNNSFRDPRHQLLKACADEQIVGFFIVEAMGDDVYWHLTAIAPQCQGQGYGRRVWQSVIMRHRAEGFARVRTTVSARNPAVMNLYGTLGGRFGEPQMTFHWVRP